MKANWLDESGKLGDEISGEFLATQGVHYQELAVDPSAYQGPIDQLKSDKGYVEQDQVSLTPDMPNLDEICAKFAGEHFHDEDEVRFVLDGAGVFDIRSADDRWMRVEVVAGDLIVVPAKRFHRFFLSESKHIQCVRLFQDKSGWVPHYRAA